MTTDQKLEVTLDALKRIKAMPETSYGDHWSTDMALCTDDVHDIVDQALCFCLPIEEVRQELIEQGIDTANLKSWASERLKEVQSRNPAPEAIENLAELGLHPGNFAESHDVAGVHTKPPYLPITMQDVRLATGEGRLHPKRILDAVNAILRQRGGSQP